MPILKREPDLYPADLFGSAGDEQAHEVAVTSRGPCHGPWWVAHVRSRQEKLLARHLRAHDIAHYLPQRKQRRPGAVRPRTSYLPLFPGYLFFRGGGAERLAAFGSGVIVRLLEVPEQAALERELIALWRLQAAGAPLVPWEYIGPGDEVEITDGPLRGWSGTVLRTKGALRLVVSVTFLRQSVAAEVDREIVAPLAPPSARRGGVAQRAARG